VILGHLVPAGTGFRSYQDSEVRIRPQALDALAVEKESVLSRHFPLLDGPAQEPVAEPAGQTGDGSGGVPVEEQAPAEPIPSPLENLFGDPPEPSPPAE